jgi:CDP-glycerol glycerophosphotransferase
MEVEVMKISVIIPHHRGEDYLRDCLDSLKEQSYREIEILLICDQVSSDELNLLSDYTSELDIKVFHLEGKTGVAAARNLGLRKASGDYIYFLDSDDYLYSDTLEILAQAAEDGEGEHDIIYGKKKHTWFHRNTYFARNQEEEDSEEDDDTNDTDNGADNDDAKDSSDDTTEGDPDEAFDKKKDRDDFEDDQEDSEDSSDDEEYDLTPEELEIRRQAVIQKAYRELVSKRKGVRNISVLNILFKRSFVEENKLCFSEDLTYFSDVPFLMEALEKTEQFQKCYAALYVKRKHNDPVNFPSLSQVRDPNRFDEFIYVYYCTIQKVAEDSDLRYRFDKKYISYYTKTFAPKIKRSNNDAWRQENFIRMSDIVRGMSPELIHEQKGYKKRIIKALMKKDIEKSLRIVKVHLGYKKLKKIFRSKKAFCKFLYIHSFLKKPLNENWIIFESFFGKSYSDSPKYIYEYLAKNYPDKYRFIWVINKKTEIPYKHKEIKRFSLGYYYYLARCKYLVFNGRQPVWMVKREGNIFLQTWHGTPLKKLVFDIDDISSATPKYKQQVYKQSREWDYLIAPNAFSSETFRRCFMFDKTMLETGYPRNDILHAPDRKQIAVHIKKKLRIPEDKKVILYAPTWRDDEFYAKGQYKFELHLNLEMMRRELGQEYVLLLRTHYFIADSIDVSALEGFAHNVSKYNDISELYLISDILITDYSSVFFDYANLKRPMLFFTYDLEKYRDVLRGFYFDIEREVPGPLVFTSEEVIDTIRNIEEISKQYSQRYDEFYHRFCEWEDGHASEKVVKSVFEIEEKE